MIFVVFVAAFVTLACAVVPLAILAAFAFGKRERKDVGAPADGGAKPELRPDPVRGSRGRETVVT